MVRTSILVWMVNDREAGQEIASILEHTVDIRCKRVFSDCDELNQAIEQTLISVWPDVVVFNGAFKGSNDVAHKIRQFKKLAPRIKCLLKIDLDSVEDETADDRQIEANIISLWLDAVRNGTNAVLLEEGIGPLITTIRESYFGGQWMPASVALALQPALESTNTPDGNPLSLSSVSNKVYAHLITGFSRDACMSSLGITPERFGRCLQEIYLKIHRLEGIVDQG